MRKLFSTCLIAGIVAVLLTTVKSADSETPAQLQGNKSITFIFKSGARETISFWSGTLVNAVTDFQGAANKRSYSYEPQQPSQKHGTIVVDFADVSAVFLEKL
jgi:hypothetical protein